MVFVLKLLQEQLTNSNNCFHESHFAHHEWIFHCIFMQPAGLLWGRFAVSTHFLMVSRTAAALLTHLTFSSHPVEQNIKGNYVLPVIVEQVVLLERNLWTDNIYSGILNSGSFALLAILFQKTCVQHEAYKLQSHSVIFHCLSKQDWFSFLISAFFRKQWFKFCLLIYYFCN